MAWQNFQIAYRHALRDVMLAGLTTVGTESTTYPLENLIDNRFADTLFAWTDSSSAHVIDVDLGASYITGLNRLYIPTGHNLNGGKLKVEEDDNSSFTSPTTLYSETSISSTDAVNITLTASSERYIRISFPTVAGAWELPQLFLTEMLTFTAGPEPGWSVGLENNVTRLSNGDTIQDDSDQWVISYRYRKAGKLAAADLSNLDAFASYVSTFHPFLLDTTLEGIFSTTPTRIMKLVSGVGRGSDAANPSANTRSSRFSFDMIEYLG